jgi:hypothetical protein
MMEPQEQRGLTPSCEVPDSTTMVHRQARLMQCQRSPGCMTMEEPPFSQHQAGQFPVAEMGAKYTE